MLHADLQGERGQVLKDVEWLDLAVWTYKARPVLEIGE